MHTTRSSRQEKVRSVADGAVFAGRGRRDRSRLDQLASVVTVPAGRVLTEQGHPGREFGVILDGEVVVHVDGQEVARLGAGEHYGELALLDEPRQAHGRRATVTTVTDTTVAAMTIPEFRTVLAEMPDVADRIVRTARERSGQK